MLALPLAAAAQVPAPTPTPDPWVYDDPGMHFVAPRNFYPAGQRHIPWKALGQDPTTVAGWMKPDKVNPENLVIEQEAFDGTSPDGFDTLFEPQLRNAFDAPVFKDKERISLANGMPALFMTMTSGSGFTAMKAFIVMWADGARGVAVVLNTRVGDISVASAKKLLLNCSAVRYPVGRDE